MDQSGFYEGPRYLTVTETAKLVRRALADRFPGVKFSVRSDRYAGGASIDVRWTDGPTHDEVEQITAGFEGARFDGMIDMAYNVTSWLEPDGTAHLAGSPGTGGQKGSHPERLEDAHSGAAQLVHMGADYVTPHRTISAELVASCADLVTHNGRCRRGDRCEICWDHMATEECWAVSVERHGSPRVLFVCSQLCGQKAAAAQRSAGVAAA